MKKTKHKTGPMTEALGVSGKLMSAADRELGKAVGYNPRDIPEITTQGLIDYAGTMRDGAVTVTKSTLRLIDKEFKKYGGELFHVVDSTGKHMLYALVVKRAKNPAKFERCVKDVKKQGGPVNAYAVCTAAGTRGKEKKNPPPTYRKASFDSLAAAQSFIRVMEADRNIAILSKPEKKGGKLWVEYAVLQGGNPRKPTIYEALRDKLGREPTNAELKADVERIKREAIEEMAAKGKLPHQRKGRGRKNPEDTAADMYEAFHGEPSKEVLEFDDEEHYHSNLAGLGSMIGLKIRTITGFDWTVEFKDVMLCSNEEGTQLYLVGGDQYLELADAKIPDTHDSTVIGEAWAIGYKTEKDFDDFRPTDYIHGFGKEKDHPKLPKNADLWEDAEPPYDDSFGKGNYPVVRYDCINHKVYLDGGAYTIKKPMFGTSPGIEG